MKRVIVWVRDTRDEYGGDASLLFMTGGSAGGHLTRRALTANDPQFQPGFEDVDTTLTAATLPLYGDYDWLDTTVSV